ncbi:hypothetical protein SAMN05444338_103169 [Flavobacterium degerlachei]|uniref:Uncharacterized protein n=2 Tax=Flavobacterium degerlachei TaxID=229203 RepID=A0A1H2UIS4_9FLAO|nr:hypothetical protein SAMN05444338_103169 [Flavobacterium degerlachei]
MLNSEKTGITLGLSSCSSEKMVEKYSVSYDDENKIERITKELISFGKKISKTDFFKRLIRDIQSTEEKTRELASAILCDFLEFDIADFEFKNLKFGIEIIIEQLKTEKNINAEQKLTEGLFEFILHEKMSTDQKTELLEKLTEISSYVVWSYLGDELQENSEELNSEKLQKYYIENIPKWKEKDEQIYEKEKIDQYYKKVK